MSKTRHLIVVNLLSSSIIDTTFTKIYATSFKVTMMLFLLGTLSTFTSPSNQVEREDFGWENWLLLWVKVRWSTASFHEAVLVALMAGEFELKRMPRAWIHVKSQDRP